MGYFINITVWGGGGGHYCAPPNFVVSSSSTIKYGVFIEFDTFSPK